MLHFRKGEVTIDKTDTW